MKLSNIYKIYHNKLDNVEVFKDMSLDLPKQGIALVYGASGSGKTTLFNILAGLDNDFTGEVSGNENIEYLSQNIELYENLTVLENLKLIQNNNEHIEQLLTKFELVPLMNKKVKKLSNGEKRRVQIIRSSLVSPDIFICDEPTASLDETNAKLVCVLLKEMSKTMTVLIATHDQSLFQSYADIIYEIKDKKINKIEESHQATSQMKNNRVAHRRTFKDYCISCWMNIKAHKTFTLITIIFLVLMIWAGYSTIYYGLSSNADYQKNIWRYSSNLIEGLPVQFELDSIDSRWRRYNEYDLYDVNIVNQIKNNENIIGYSLTNDIDSFKITNDSFSINYDADPNDKEEMEKLSAARYLPFIAESYEFYYFGKVDDGYSYGYQWPITPYVFIKEAKVDESDKIIRTFIYEIYDFNKIPLQYGIVPANENDVVIGIDLANTLCSSLGITSPEQLLNKELTLEIVGNLQEIESFMKVKISGITSFDNQFENRIYFNDGAYSSSLANLFHFNKNKAKFQSLKLLVDPSEDMSNVITRLNQSIPSQYNQFALFNGTTNAFAKNFQEIYQNTTIVSIISIIIMSIALIGLLFMKFFFRKQLKKEYRILNKYGYSLVKNELLNSSFICTFLIIIILIFFPAVVSLFNQVSLQYFHKEIFTVNYIMMFVNCILVFIIYTIMMLLTSHFIIKDQ